MELERNVLENEAVRINDNDTIDSLKLLKRALALNKHSVFEQTGLENVPSMFFYIFYVNLLVICTFIRSMP